MIAHVLKIFRAIGEGSLNLPGNFVSSPQSSEPPLNNSESAVHNSESAVRATLQGFINSLNQHNFKEAYSYFDPSLGESFDHFASFWRRYRIGSIKHSIYNIQDKGDGTYTAIVSLNGDDMGGYIERISFSYELILMNSKWQIVDSRKLRDDY